MSLRDHFLNPVWVNGVQKLRPSHNVSPPKPARGLVPTALDESLHAVRCMNQLRSKTKSVQEITPLIYTPTVGDACLQFSHIYRRPEGLVIISYKDKGNILKVLRNWPRIDEGRIAVVTDGSRILGLGDLGLNGMPISIGKLSLYVAGAGIRPSSTIPICLDLGTNNQKFLEDPFYLGLRQPRVPSVDMTAFMDEFMDAMRTVFPKLLIQFEDFSTDNAFLYLSRYRNRYPLFNDDIQGTGAVVLSGFLNAAKLSAQASGRPLEDQRILFFGAGSAGVGVATQLMAFFRLQGMSEEEARQRIWLVDSQGLIFDTRGPMAEHKKLFSRPDYNGPPMTDLTEIVKYVKPTALLGLSTIKNAFSQSVVETMSAINPRPIIFPLSNPVIFASGSPFPEEEHAGRMLYPGQGNNMYIFPGLGLGAILARASKVTDSMVEASSLGLADSLTAEEKALDMIYPRVERIREISEQIATKVIRAAQRAGVDQNTEIKDLWDDQLGNG
ncbi:malic enzyme [Fomitopsis serialis]|uniref:malic enzyme n=1 Tax=Fomitopsis serialis TaxID=139415 RepID=UPI002008A33A|nr:malic enzyme [Neoantrodia serialis]KAH9932963.1 malic enzyme [Neoantrodia serialis]